MKKLFNLLFYYSLLFLGLFMISWMLWARFIRARTIRDIPDGLFTEYRFWILIYICYIYLFIVKSLVKPKETNLILKEFLEIIYKPLKILDKHIKYKFMKSFYDNRMQQSIQLLDILEINVDIYFYFQLMMQIIPRIILVTFLLLDTFYFQKLEIFYKVILIGLIPWIYSYIIYSLKDIYEKWIEDLETQYTFVTIFEEGFVFKNAKKENTDAIYHYERKSIKEYIEIKIENMLKKHDDSVEYTYIGIPQCKQDFMTNYLNKKYNNIKTYPGSKDILYFEQLFTNLMPLIIKLNILLSCLNYLNDDYKIKGPKIAIFSLYFICWSYILIICYFIYPVKLIMGAYFLENFLIYIMQIEYNPFAEDYMYSLNENLITIENMRHLIKKIIKTIFKLFFITIIILYIFFLKIKESFTVYCESQELPQEILIPLKKSIEDSLLLLAKQNIVNLHILSVFSILFKQDPQYFINDFVKNLPLIELLKNTKFNTPELLTQEIINLFIEYLNRKQTQINEKAFKLFIASFFFYRMYSQNHTISLQDYFTPHPHATEPLFIITEEVYKLFLTQEMQKQHIYYASIETGDTANFSLIITFYFFYFTLKLTL